MLSDFKCDLFSGCVVLFYSHVFVFIDVFNNFLLWHSTDGQQVSSFRCIREAETIFMLLLDHILVQEFPSQRCQVHIVRLYLRMRTNSGCAYAGYKHTRAYLMC